MNKTTVRCHFHQDGSYQENRVTSVGVDVEKLELLRVTGGTVSGASTVENSMTVPQKNQT